MQIKKKFCHHCGKEQSILSAKFCMDCGVSLSSVNSKPVTREPQEELPSPIMTGDDDEDNLNVDRMTRFRTSLSRLELDIKKPDYTPEKLGSFAGTDQSSNIESRGVGPYARLSAEEIQSEFQKEAGTFRKDA